MFLGNQVDNVLHGLCGPGVREGELVTVLERAAVGANKGQHDCLEILSRVVAVLADRICVEVG